MKQEIEISVPVADGTAKVSTVKGGPPWPVPMLVFIHVTRRQQEWLKHYESPEEAKADFEESERRYREWKEYMGKAQR